MKKLLLALVFISASCGVANAQAPNTLGCTGFDTASSSTSSLANLTRCSFTTGPYGLALITATGEVECGSPGMTAQLFYGAGATPINGSSFFGKITSGVLEPTRPVTPFASWTLQAGQTLNGAGFAAVTITGLVSQNATVTFTNGSASIGWTNTLIPNQAVKFTTTGTLPTNFVPNTTYYVIPTGLTGSTVQVAAAPDNGTHVVFTNGSASIAWTNTLVTGQAVFFTTSNSLPTNFAENTVYYVLATGLTGSTVQVATMPAGTPIVAGSADTGGNFGYGNFGAPITAGSAGSGVQTGDGVIGGIGTYTLSGSPPNITNQSMYATSAIPGGATAITPLLHQTACTGQFFITSITGVFAGSARTQYWADVAIATSNTSSLALWANGTITIITY